MREMRRYGGPIHPFLKLQIQKKRQTINLAFSLNMGWTKGIEPSTTGVTIPCSTN